MPAHSNTYRGFALADSDDLNKFNEYTNICRVNFQFCLRGGFEANNLDYYASNVGYVSAAVGLCKKTAISKSDIEPTALNLHFSQWLSQINQTTSCTHPLLSVCGLLPWWPA